MFKTFVQRFDQNFAGETLNERQIHHWDFFRDRPVHESTSLLTGHFRNQALSQPAVMTMQGSRRTPNSRTFRWGAGVNKPGTSASWPSSFTMRRDQDYLKRQPASGYSLRDSAGHQVPDPMRPLRRPLYASACVLLVQSTML
jgi:hypothetical protein